MSIEIRQIIDIQNQIKNQNGNFEVNSLRSIFDYNLEIKKYLLENVEDEMILKYINELPNFRVEDFKTGFDFIGFLMSVFSGNFDTFNQKRIDFSKAEIALNEISDKYASIEKMIENNSASL